MKVYILAYKISLYISSVHNNTEKNDSQKKFLLYRYIILSDMRDFASQYDRFYIKVYL